MMANNFALTVFLHDQSRSLIYISNSIFVWILPFKSLEVKIFKESWHETEEIKSNPWAIWFYLLLNKDIQQGIFAYWSRVMPPVNKLLVSGRSVWVIDKCIKFIDNTSCYRRQIREELFNWCLQLTNKENAVPKIVSTQWPPYTGTFLFAVFFLVTLGAAERNNWFQSACNS